jgi:hypothetical protein
MFAEIRRPRTEIIFLHFLEVHNLKQNFNFKKILVNNSLSKRKPWFNTGNNLSRQPNSVKFWVKRFHNSLKTGPNVFLQHFKNKIIFNVGEICGYEKRYDNKFFSPLSFVAVFGSGIQDPGSEIRDPRSGIRDPGSGMSKNQDPG